MASLSATGFTDRARFIDADGIVVGRLPQKPVNRTLELPWDNEHEEKAIVKNSLFSARGRAGSSRLGDQSV
jgi:hypothetical protein